MTVHLDLTRLRVHLPDSLPKTQTNFNIYHLSYSIIKQYVYAGREWHIDPVKIVASRSLSGSLLGLVNRNLAWCLGCHRLNPVGSIKICFSVPGMLVT